MNYMLEICNEQKPQFVCKLFFDYVYNSLCINYTESCMFWILADFKDEFYFEIPLVHMKVKPEVGLFAYVLSVSLYCN